jgi:hypothetical protein
MNASFTGPVKSLTREPLMLYGEFLTTTNGTLSTAANAVVCDGFTIVKTPSKTGRYTITYRGTEIVPRIGGISVVIVGPADVAFTASRGCFSFIRNVTTRGFDIQFALTADAGHTDAELPDGARVYISIPCANVPVNT